MSTKDQSPPSGRQEVTQSVPAVLALNGESEEVPTQPVPPENGQNGEVEDFSAQMANFLNHESTSGTGTDVSSKEKMKVGMVLKDHLKISTVDDAEELAMNVILSDQSMITKTWHSSAIGSKVLYLCANQDTTNLAWNASKKQLPHPLYFLFHPQENHPDA